VFHKFSLSIKNDENFNANEFLELPLIKMLQKYLILAIYFSILFLIGYYSFKHIKDVKDYYVGGEKFGFSNIEHYEIYFVKLGELPVAFSATLIIGIIVSILDKNKKNLNELEFVN